MIFHRYKLLVIRRKIKEFLIIFNKLFQKMSQIYLGSNITFGRDCFRLRKNTKVYRKYITIKLKINKNSSIRVHPIITRKCHFYFFRIQLDNIQLANQAASGWSCNIARGPVFYPIRARSRARMREKSKNTAEQQPLLRNFPRCRANGHVNKVLARAREEHEA